MTAPTIVGAYAAMPRAIAERECLYRSLAETGWVDGIEIPYRDGLDADPRWLADQLRDRFAHCVVTAIPGTCLLYTSPSPRDQRGSRMPSSA